MLMKCGTGQFSSNCFAEQAEDRSKAALDLK